MYYFVSGIIAICLSWAMTGCRLGNRTETAKPDPATDSAINGPSGFYSTTANAYSLIATTNTDLRGDFTPTAIPQKITDLMTNPAVIYVNNNVSGAGFLANKTMSGSYFDIFYNTDGTWSVAPVSGTIKFWAGDPDCQSQASITITGTTTRFASKQSVNGYPATGHLTMTYTYREVLDPARCAAALPKMKACFDDVNQCGGATADENKAFQQEVDIVFGTHIANSVMTENDILSVRSIGYEVTYK